MSHEAVVAIDGKSTLIDIAETDHCCKNFALADEWLRASGAQREGQVGHGHGRLVDSKAIVAEAVARLRTDPLLFLCRPAVGCEECDLARASVG